MENQMNLFSEPTGEQLKKDGMVRAENHANMVNPDWSVLAENYVCRWITIEPGQPFIMEDIRRDSAGIIPEPPTNRAWGAVIQRVAKRGLIRKIGITKRTDPGAHQSFCTEWIANL